MASSTSSKIVLKKYNVKDIFNAVENFLISAKDAGALKDFTLSYPEEELNVSSDVEQACRKLVENLATIEIPLKQDACAVKDLQEQNIKSDIMPIEKNQEINVTSENSSAIVQMEVDHQEIPLKQDACAEQDLQEQKNEEIKVTSKNNSALIQIQVDRNEINRRIASFVSRKRKEVDDWNIQEFCSSYSFDDGHPLWDQVDSCARVNAVFVPRSGSKSHVKVSRVENVIGPQTQQNSYVDSAKRFEHLKNPVCPLENVEERLRNMESHLKLKSESTLRLDIYARIKELENRILYLEGLSPDYFHPTRLNHNHLQRKSEVEIEKTYSKWSLVELQKRIQFLKDELKSENSIKNEPLD